MNFQELGDREVAVVYASADKSAELRAALVRTKLVKWQNLVHVLSVLQEHVPLVVEAIEAHGMSTYFSHVNVFYMTAEQASNLVEPRYN